MKDNSLKKIDKLDKTSKTNQESMPLTIKMTKGRYRYTDMLGNYRKMQIFLPINLTIYKVNNF